jgi:hypothetical protein
MHKRCVIWVNSGMLIMFETSACVQNPEVLLLATLKVDNSTITTRYVLYTCPHDNTTGILIRSIPSPPHFSPNVHVIFIFSTAGWNNSWTTNFPFAAGTDCSFCFLVYTGPETCLRMQCVLRTLALTMKWTELEDNWSHSVYVMPIFRTFGTLRPYTPYNITSRCGTGVTPVMYV